MSNSAETPSSSLTLPSPAPDENNSPPPEDSSPPPSSLPPNGGLSASLILASPPSNNSTSSGPTPPTQKSPPSPITSKSPPPSSPPPATSKSPPPPTTSKSPPPSSPPPTTSKSPPSSPPPKSQYPPISPPPSDSNPPDESSSQPSASSSTSPPPPTSPKNESPLISEQSSPPPPDKPPKTPTADGVITTPDSTKSSPPPPPGEFIAPPAPILDVPTPNSNTTSPAASPRTQSTSPPSTGSSSSSNNSSSTSSNNAPSKNDGSGSTSKVVVGAVLTGVVLIAVVVIFFVAKKKKKRHDLYPPHYMPPKNFAVQTADGYYYGPQQPQVAGYSNMANYSYGSQPSYSPESLDNMNGDSGVISGTKTHFSYDEVMEMTNGFSRQNIVGEGGFGCVFKGQSPDGKEVAVKQLKVGSGQGDREFKAEVEIISRVHHKHLVSLVGFCISDRQRLLLYEFVPNKTLEHHLHSKGMPLLDWPKRLKIAIGAAKGLAYLHEDCNPKIFHRDIKSANILLDHNFEALVADFGLARLNDTAQTHVSTRVMGTFGYLAPEYASSGKLTDRSDVYSFGVVLLELITGRKPVDPTQPLGDESLVEWARPILIRAIETGDVSEIVDPRLEKRYVESEMFRMIEIAAACVRHSAPKRPRMVQVVRALDSEQMSDLTNGVKYGQSTAYDSDQYNEEITRFRRTAFSSEDGSEFNTESGEYSSRELVSHRAPNF